MKIFVLLFTTIIFSLPLSAADTPHVKSPATVKEPLLSGDLKITSDLIKSAVGKILTTLKNDKIDKQTKRADVIKVMEPLFNLKYIAKVVLGRKHWPKFSKNEQSEFTDLFIKQLQDSYFEKVDLLTDESVEVKLPIRKKKNTKQSHH